jgi:lysylphosphatidylglycerol synthetase-like protein (DUF2156 family)
VPVRDERLLPDGGALAEDARVRDTAWFAMASLLLVGLILLARGLVTREAELTAVGAGGLLTARGLSSGRRTKPALLAASLTFLGIARIYVLSGHAAVAIASTLAAGTVVVRPARPPKPTDAGRRRQVEALVQATVDDPIAPFALRSDKAHVLAPNGRAAVAYAVRFGTAVASGDAVGAADARPAAAREFLRHARSQGWRTVVLATAEDQLPLWREAGLRAVPIGRDVRLRPEQLDMVGRRFRNLRQAVSRTHNAGLTTEVIPEADLDPALRNELLDIVAASGRSPHPRGFSMILDGLLDGTHQGTLLAVARTPAGDAVAFQRFATAADGRELSLDVPYRRPGTPNGTDERLVVDVVRWAAERGVQHVSLAFAPFPELFATTDRSLRQRLAYWGVHRLDPLLGVESLYRFLRKFHAFDRRRYIVLRPRDVLFAAAAALWLEFGRRS